MESDVVLETEERDLVWTGWKSGLRGHELHVLHRSTLFGRQSLGEGQETSLLAEEEGVGCERDECCFVVDDAAGQQQREGIAIDEGVVPFRKRIATTMLVGVVGGSALRCVCCEDVVVGLPGLADVEPVVVAAGVDVDRLGAEDESVDPVANLGGEFEERRDVVIEVGAGTVSVRPRTRTRLAVQGNLQMHGLLVDARDSAMSLLLCVMTRHGECFVGVDGGVAGRGVGMGGIWKRLESGDARTFPSHAMHGRVNE